MNTSNHRRVALVGACVAAVVSLGACGSDSDDSTGADDTTATNDTSVDTTTAAVDTTATNDTAVDTTTAPADTTATTAADAAGETVVVAAMDYAFGGLPETAPAGTKFSLVNEGTEPHELVAIRIPDEETRPVEELIQLPEEELDAIFGAAMPATVILAATGQTDVPGAVVGDGTISEPGRYAVVCFLPVGSDDSILEADGPPPAGEAPPHAAEGMFAELTIEG